jgi:two-component system, LytTR family, response regulator
MTLNAIIVDDEPAARSMLRQIITEHCPMINLIDEAPDVKSAVKIINNHTIDLVFLDIEMPEENGFALFEYFNQPTFETIFCTAYSEYALRAFEVSAVDYILKPISISKVILAVEKAIKVNSKKLPSQWQTALSSYNWKTFFSLKPMVHILS